MPEFIDVVSMFNNFNLTGDPAGTLSIPSLTLDKDLQDNYIIDYTFFRNQSDVTSTSYYTSTHTGAVNIVDGSDYNSNMANVNIPSTVQSNSSWLKTAFSDDNIDGDGVVLMGTQNCDMHGQYKAGTKARAFC